MCVCVCVCVCPKDAFGAACGCRYTEVDGKSLAQPHICALICVPYMCALYVCRYMEVDGTALAQTGAMARYFTYKHTYKAHLIGHI